MTNRQYNFRVDIFKKLIDNTTIDYQVEFPEFYLAKIFANAMLKEKNITGIYILERISDGTFDVTKRIL